MAIKKIPCGGWLYDDEQITFEDGVMKVIGGGDIPPEVSNAVETHGMGWTSEEEVEGFDIQWDGNTEGLERAEDYVKISDLDIPNDQIVGLKYDGAYSDTHEFFQTYEVTQELFEEFIEFEQINDDYAWLDYLFIIHKDGVVVDGIEFAHKGIYVNDPEDLEGYISRIYKEATTEEVVHQIDQKYIPQGSGRRKIVHVTVDNTLNTTADTTFSELLELINDGVNVVAQVQFTFDSDTSFYFNFCMASDVQMYFGTYSGEEFIGVIANNDDSWEYHGM